MSEEANKEVQEVLPQPVEQQGPNLPEVLKKRPGAPSQQQIDAWKNQHGDVFVSGFSEEEIYVWRPLNRLEYKQLQQTLADPQSGWTELSYEEAVCDKCVLWPKAEPQYWTLTKGGTASTVSGQIFAQSNFLPPAAASMLVAKL